MASDEARKAFEIKFGEIDEENDGFFGDFEIGYTQGRADAWKSLVMKYHLVDFVYYCKLQEQQFERQETATKYAEEYMKEYVKLPGGEND